VGPVSAQKKPADQFRERLTVKRQKISEIHGKNDPEFTLEHEGIDRKYKIHIPRKYDPEFATALVIYIHGGGGNMTAAYMDGLADMSDKYGFILAVPESTGKNKLGRLWGIWNGGKWEGGECCGSADDIGFIDKMISAVGTDYNIDPGRVYVTGISNGGLMTNRIGCELADKIAAIAPVAATGIETNCTPSLPVPVMIIHGTNDPANPPDGSDPRGIFKKGLFSMPYKRMTPYETTAKWLNINKCSGRIVSGFSNNGAKCLIYDDCSNDAEVVLCIVEGMGHTFPGGSQYLPENKVGKRTDDMTFDQIWEFFRKHERRP
jgi:polyhydroxybutyrate depolymerase